ncbi:MAG: Gfo/Idh/MocA family oxidoreductase [Patescibacteria group bacterium]
MKRNKNILVTGANGFIGKKVVSQFLASGYNVTAMIRPGKIAPFIPHNNLTILWANLLDYNAYKGKLGYIDAIVHLAADKYGTKMSYKINVGGTRNVIRLLEDHCTNSNRIINISSQSTKLQWKGKYGKSKKISDEIIHSSQTEWTTIMPGLVYGKEKGNLFYTMVHYTKLLPFVPVIGSGKHLLYPITVEEFAKVIVKTFENSKTIRKIYEIGEGPINLNDFIYLIQKGLKIKKPIIHIPFWLGLIGGYLGSKVIPNFPISVDNVLGSNQKVSSDSRKIKKDLGMKFINVHSGVKQYFLKHSKTLTKNIAIIGLGKMGTFHAAVLSTIQNVKIVALIDSLKELCTNAQSMGVKASAYSSLDEAVKMEKIDAVFICTPTFTHKKLILSCLDKSLPYFIEKPALKELVEFEEIRKRKYKNINNISASGYFWVYKREIRYVKQLLEKGIIGKIKGYKIHLKHSEVFGKKKGWQFTKKLLGGGVLMNPGPHAFSVIRYLFGKGEVTSSQIKFLFSNEVEDKAIIYLRHKNFTGTLDASWSEPKYPVMTIEFFIIGSKGEIKYEDQTLTLSLKGLPTKIKKYYELPSYKKRFNLNYKSGGDVYYREDELFINNLHENKVLVNSINFAFEVEKMISQSYEKANIHI